jgi:hypothetical protein
LLPVLLMLSGCKEVFYPGIEAVGPLVVVEGRITNEEGPHFIRLSETTGYGSGEFGTPLENAEVWVREVEGASYRFLETEPGEYRSPAGMTGKPGKTYLLEFETPDGLVYQSAPQFMYPPYEQTGLLARESVRTETRMSNSGQLIITEIDGLDAFLQLREQPDNRANVRFTSDVKVLYIYEGGGFIEPIKYFCWKKTWHLEGVDNINLPTTSNEPGDVNNNVVAFLPHDRKRYNIDPLNDFLQTLAMRVKVYSLNEDAYTYYLEVNKQLTSDGSIFAPIPSQLTSNIFCLTEPRRAAVGLFEASAVATQAYILRQPPNAETTFFEITDKYEGVPTKPGCSINEPPPFWFN